jgi:hypothetical protein
MVSHVVYPVTEEVRQYLFDPYDAERVQVLMETTHMEAIVSFRSAHDAIQARAAYHGRCILDACNVMNIYLVLPSALDNMPERTFKSDIANSSDDVHATTVFQPTACVPKTVATPHEPLLVLIDELFANAELHYMKPTTCAPDHPIKDTMDNIVARVPPTAEIIVVSFDAIPEQKKQENAGRRCCTMKWKSGVHVGHRAIHWPVRVLHDNMVRDAMVTHIGGCSLFSDIHMELAVPVGKDVTTNKTVHVVDNHMLKVLRAKDANEYDVVVSENSKKVSTVKLVGSANEKESISVVHNIELKKLLI